MVAAGLILAALAGALIHRYRGGGFDLPRPGRSLWVAAPVVGLLAWPFLGLLPAAYLAALYLLGSVNGWGSYFDCGEKRAGWSDHPEVEWIDRLLLAWFGPEWATDADRIHPVRAARGDVIVNEGRTRSLHWQRRRDCTGMALRGLHYLPAFLVIPTATTSWPAILPGILALTLFAPAYRLGHLAPRHWPRELRGTALSEYLVGAIFGAALAGQYLVGV